MRIVRSRPYYPQTKGKVERSIRNINEEYLRLYSDVNSDTLADYIVWYNTARYHDGIGMTPAERYFGFRIEYSDVGLRLLDLIARVVVSPSRKNLSALAGFHDSVSCAECGGETIRYGFYRHNGFRFQKYRCRSCGVVFSLWSLVLRAVRRRYPRCPRCESNDKVIRWGSGVWMCTDCGRAFTADVKWLSKKWLTT